MLVLDLSISESMLTLRLKSISLLGLLFLLRLAELLLFLLRLAQLLPFLLRLVEELTLQRLSG